MMSEKNAAETNLEIQSRLEQKAPKVSKENMSKEDANIALNEEFYGENRQDDENIAPTIAASPNTFVIDLDEEVED